MHARSPAYPILAIALLLMACAVGPDAPQALITRSNLQPTSLLVELRERSRSQPLVVAHRGASGRFPENTMPAFRAALETGAALVETDFHESKDGVLFCMHDKTLDRTTNAGAVLGRKRIASRSLTMAELARLDAGAWKDARFAGTRIPTLVEALDLIGPRAIPMIEHKQGSAAKLVHLLREKQLLDRAVVMSFDWGWLEEVHRLEQRVFIAALGKDAITAEHYARLHGTGACMVHWRLTDLRIEDVQELRDAGYMTCAYTVDSDAGMIGGATLGLDGITTNRPGRLRELVRQGVVKR